MGKISTNKVKSGDVFIPLLNVISGLLATITPIFAYAGIAIGRTWIDFVKLGWRSVVVAMFVMVGTFLGSALFAEVVLRMQKII